jgi:hypothetical protein
MHILISIIVLSSSPYSCAISIECIHKSYVYIYTHICIINYEHRYISIFIHKYIYAYIYNNENFQDWPLHAPNIMDQLKMRPLGCAECMITGAYQTTYHSREPVCSLGQTFFLNIIITYIYIYIYNIYIYICICNIYIIYIYIYIYTYMYIIILFLYSFGFYGG